MKTGPKKHHYVSQMQLRFFSIDGRGKQVFAYDKEADDVRVLAIADAAAQAGYYTVPSDDGPSLEVEERLALIEGRVHPALDRLTHIQPPPFGSFEFRLDPADRAWLCGYIALQHLRVPAQREAFQVMWNLQGTLTADIMLQDPNRYAKEVMRTERPDRESERGRKRALDSLRKGRMVVTSDPAVSIKTMLEMVGIVEERVRRMRLLLLKRFKSPHFLISDNPVQLWAPEGHSPLMGVGFATPGVEVTLPIDPMTVLSGTNDESLPEVVLPAQRDEPVLDMNRRLWRFATRFVFGQRREDLEAVKGTMSKEDRVWRPPTVDMASHGGPEWTSYAERAKQRPPRSKLRRRPKS
jgi:hypothetical protein